MWIMSTFNQESNETSTQTIKSMSTSKMINSTYISTGISTTDLDVSLNDSLINIGFNLASTMNTMSTINTMNAISTMSAKSI